MRSPLPVLLALLPVLLLQPRPVRAEDEIHPFTGRIVYEQTAAGDSDGAKAFRGMAASRVVVHVGTPGYRQDEEGGLNEGSYLIRRDAAGALRLDHDRRTSERGGAMDLEQTEPKVRALMPWHFETELEATDATDTILGHAVRRHRVKRSAFVREGATAFVWIAEDVVLPPMRYQFEFDAHRTVSPLPLSIPVPKGAILKAEITEGGVPVTITMTALERGTPDPALFAKPEGYEGPGFRRILPTEHVGAAPATPALSEAELAKLPARVTTKSGMTLVLVRPGTFTMGSPADEPGRRDDEGPFEVTLTRPYYIGIHEVTQAQWRAVMGTASPSKFEGNDRPVESVTWAQARAFCARLSEAEGKTFLLPTEAQWEYAARAGETYAYAPHRTFKAWLAAHAWQYFNAQYTTHPVGALKPNAWGLYDTIGNVSEWTADRYGPYPDGPATDPAGVAGGSRIVVRGADWVTSHDLCRHATRSTQDPAQAKSTIGFRVVRLP